MISLDAGSLARGWLAVYHATGREASRPQLYKTIHLDQYPNGLRLAATDSWMLLTCWVPDSDDEFAPEPGLEEVPYASATVIDRHGWAVSLLTYLHALSKDDDCKGLTVDVRLNVPWQPEDTDPKDLQIDGFEALAVALDCPDRERLQLEVFEGGYPRWQALAARQRAASACQLGLSAEVCGRVSKAARAADAGLVEMWFGGPDKPIQVEFGDMPTVTGLVMPCAWDFQADAPYGQQVGGGDGGGE